MSENPPAVLDVVALLRARWRRVALAVGVGAVVALAYGFLAPKWYESRLAVVPAPTPKGGMPLLGGSGGMGGLTSALNLPFDIGLGTSDVERIAAIFHSNSVSDAVIQRFGLLERYRERYLVDARRQLWSHCHTKIDKKPAVVELTCEDREPEVAKAMAEFFGETANQVFQRVSKSSASDERRFLEQRVAEAKRDMVAASLRLREFQEKHKVIDLPEQSKAVVSSIASMRAEMLAKQVQLSFLDGFSARDESAALQLNRQIAILENKMRAMEESQGLQAAEAPASAPARRRRAARGAARDGSGLFPPALSVPKLRFDLEQLYRDQKIQELLFLMLTQRYEQARVSEARDTATFQILDRPTVADKRARPRRLLALLAGLLLGVVAGGVWALGGPWWHMVAGRKESGVSAPEAGPDGQA